MYGLSLKASLLCASATRFLASATRCARSSLTFAGVPDSDFECGVVPGVGLGVEPGLEDIAGDGIAALVGRGLVGIGAAIPCVLCGAGPLRDEVFMAASLAAISARFWRMRSFAES
jgi:hypothetical protein